MTIFFRREEIMGYEVGFAAIGVKKEIGQNRMVKILMLVIAGVFIACSILPVFAADNSSISTAYKSLAQSLFELLQGLFACTCCVVILVSLFLMLIATGDREVQSGVHRIKVAVACLVVAYLVPFIIQKVLDALSGSNSSNDIQNLTLPQ